MVTNFFTTWFWQFRWIKHILKDTSLVFVSLFLCNYKSNARLRALEGRCVCSKHPWWRVIDLPFRQTKDLYYQEQGLKNCDGDQTCLGLCCFCWYLFCWSEGGPCCCCCWEEAGGGGAMLKFWLKSLSSETCSDWVLACLPPPMAGLCPCCWPKCSLPDEIKKILSLNDFF